MKFLPFLLLPFLSLPAQAITWKEFWEPFRVERHHHYYPRHIRYTPMCNVRVYHEEYIPGNRYRSGYVRTWTEWERVPCEDVDHY